MHIPDARDPHRLTLRTRFLPEPGLWCWEILYNDGDGVVLESSWEDDWVAFASRDEAYRAGAAALAELDDWPAAS